MGWLDRVIGRFASASVKNEGALLEAQGRLDEAFAAYQNAERNGDAARVLVARAESEGDPKKKLGLLCSAAQILPAGDPALRSIRARKSLLAYELVSTNPVSPPASELAEIADELESTGAKREAAALWGRVGNTENQSRLLAECGDIGDLEAVLDRQRAAESQAHVHEQFVQNLKDLDATGQRLECLRQAETWLREHPADQSVEDIVRSVQERIVRSKTLTVRLGDGTIEMIALGNEVVIGRADATINIVSPVLSRAHLAIRTAAGGPIAVDLGSRNGTLLASARLAGPVPIGSGLHLSLGGNIPCDIAPAPGGGLRVECAAHLWLAPLGPWRIGPLRVAPGPGSTILVEPADEATSVLLGALAATAPIELARGDQIRIDRTGPALFEVISE